MGFRRGRAGMCAHMTTGRWVEHRPASEAPTREGRGGLLAEQQQKQSDQGSQLLVAEGQLNCQFKHGGFHVIAGSALPTGESWLLWSAT
ncbi:hypothetical protein EGU64_12675 [Achromobacter denitrificans]|nr:hypothetical protein EGU64_12675 [Achromobacter denitrificans]